MLFLLYLMGFVGMGELRAALYTAVFMLVLLIVVFLYFKHVLKEPTLAKETLFGSFRRAIETHAEMTSYLTLLLATLGIMIGLFTVTGFINRMGATLLDLGAWNIIAMILMAWVFGWLARRRPAADRDLHHRRRHHRAADEEARHQPMGRALLRVLPFGLGRASPPTSLTAAVSARIANTSFMRTMYEALKICAPITLMTFAIFTRSDLVMKPGWPQIVDVLVVTSGTCGVAFAMFGRFFRNAVLTSWRALRSRHCPS